MNENHNLACLICARKGSKGIKNKNIKLLNGKPLINYSILFGKSIGKTYVSSDSEVILNISKKLNVNFIQRPSKLAQDNSPEILAWKHAVKEILKDQNCSDLLVLPPTSPLRKKSDILSAYKLFKKKKSKFMISIKDADRNPAYNIVKKNNSNKFSLAIDPKKKIINRQNAPRFYDVTTCFYIININYLMNINEIKLKNVDAFEVDKISGIDIDNILDFKFVEFLIKNEKNRF